MNGKKIKSILLTVCFILCLYFYNVFQGGMESKIAVHQLEDTVLGYSIIRECIKGNQIQSVIITIFTLMVLFIWRREVKKIILDLILKTKELL